MINWNKTQQEFGYSCIGDTPYKPKVVFVCGRCGAEWVARIQRKYEWKDRQQHKECRKCVAKRPEKLEKMRKAAKKRWQDPKYKEKNLKAVRSDENKEKLRKNWQIYTKPIIESREHRKKKSEIAKQLWQNPEFREKITQHSKENWKDKDLRKHMLASQRTDEYRENQRKKAKERWQDPEYIKKQQSARAKATRSPKRLAEIKVLQSKVSKPQKIFYSILDDLEVKYYREHNNKPDDPQCRIGPYSFDCVIPRDSKPDLLIEIQGNWIHSQKEVIRNDRAKSTYIANNFSEQYELKYVWEHGLYNQGKIKELVKYWLGITELNLTDFNFNDLIIRQCLKKDYELLLSKYHYIPNAGRGGKAYGAFLSDKIIAVCIFSPLIRQNITVKNYERKQIRELSRLCIHPQYQKKNFGSWFVSRCIKQLDFKIKCVIAYCDTTFNHDGALYKACNFTQDKEIRPDYWYISESKWIMHKKTLYNQAIKAKMTEKEFAKNKGYKKIFGKKKLRFIFVK